MSEDQEPSPNADPPGEPPAEEHPGPSEPDDKFEGEWHGDDDRLIRRVDGPWWSRRPKPDYPTPTGCQRVWIPIYGYLDADDDHRARVNHFFHIPMLILALLVLPVIAIEYLQMGVREERALERQAATVVETQPAGADSPESADAPLQTAPATGPSATISPSAEKTSGDILIDEHLEAPAGVPSWFIRFIRHPVMLAVIDIAMPFIWLAFFLEFVIKIAIAPSRFQYATKNWIDIVIILLPMLRVFRSMQAFRALRAAKVARMTQLYRLRGIAMKLLRTVGALVLGLEAVRKLRSRFGKGDDTPAPPDYSQWSRAALISEIEKLKLDLEEMTEERNLWQRRHRRVSESRKRQ